MSNTMLKESFNKMNMLPEGYQNAVITMIEQLYDLAVSNNGKEKKIGIADGEYNIPDDINVYDDEIARMFGIV